MRYTPHGSRIGHFMEVIALVDVERQSKYFQKHYDVEELDPFYHEVQCSHCKYVFQIDDEYTKIIHREDGDFSRIYCPYCGFKMLRAL